MLALLPRARTLTQGEHEPYVPDWQQASFNPVAMPAR